jgi:hypothetical protein
MNRIKSKTFLQNDAKNFVVSANLPPQRKNKELSPWLTSTPHPALCATLSLMERGKIRPFSIREKVPRRGG